MPGRDLTGYKRAVTPLISLTRPFNAPPMLFAFAVGYYFYPPVVAWTDLLLGLFILLLLHSSANIKNDIQDLEIDKANKREGALIDGRIPVRSARIFSNNMILGAVLLATFSHQKINFILFVLLLVAVARVYNSPPFSASRRPVASLVVLGLYYAFIPLLFGFAAGGYRIPVIFIIFALAWMAKKISVSILKDFKDKDGDQRFNKRTFYLTYGLKTTTLVSIVLAVFSYATAIAVLFLKNRQSVIVFALSGLLLIVGVVSVLYRLKLLRATTPQGLAKIFSNTFVIDNYFDALALVCLIVP